MKNEHFMPENEQFMSENEWFRERKLDIIASQSIKGGNNA